MSMYGFLRDPQVPSARGAVSHHPSENSREKKPRPTWSKSEALHKRAPRCNAAQHGVRLTGVRLRSVLGRSAFLVHAFLEGLRRLELHSLAGRDLDRLAGLRVPTLPGCAFGDLESTKP